jgi:hypothetical protein
MSHQIRSLVSDPDDTDAGLPGLVGASAPCALIGSPVISICMALPGGSSAGEPPPAARPGIASGWPKVALSDAMMKSVLWASSQPPP